MPFNFRALEIPEVIEVKAIIFEDERGFFMESYQRTAFESGGITEGFVQDNYSYSVAGVFRGLHYQNPPRAQGKLVHVLRGEILDVAVDIRKGSPTEGEAVTVSLTEDNHRMVYVPAGFAHGFLVLSDQASVVYKVTDEYAPEFDRGIIWNDPAISLDLPTTNPLVSEKDKVLPLMRDADIQFVYEKE